MQIVSIGDNLHEMSNLVFWEKIRLQTIFYEMSNRIFWEKSFSTSPAKRFTQSATMCALQKVDTSLGLVGSPSTTPNGPPIFGEWIPFRGETTVCQNRDQTPRNGASDQGLHCLQIVQPYLKSKMDSANNSVGEFIQS